MSSLIRNEVGGPDATPKGLGEEFRTRREYPVHRSNPRDDPVSGSGPEVRVGDPGHKNFLCGNPTAYVGSRWSIRTENEDINKYRRLLEDRKRIKV